MRNRHAPKYPGTMSPAERTRSSIAKAKEAAAAAAVTLAALAYFAAILL